MSTVRDNMIRLGGLVVLLLGVPSIASAAGTASGTSVSSIAIVDYQMGGVDQATVQSDGGTPTTFVVDTKIDLTITTDDVAAVNVRKSTTDNPLTFSVINTGNDVQDFGLSATTLVGGPGAFAGNTDTVDAATIAVFVEDGVNPGFQPLEDTVTYIDELAADASIKVYVVGSFGASPINGDVASYHLVAEAHIGGGAGLGGLLTESVGADNPAGVDIVFADGQGSDTTNDLAGDAKFSSQDDFRVVAATVSTGISMSVVSDPVNGTTSPVAMTGAVIEYLLTVTNDAAGSPVSDVLVTDNLNTEIVAGNIAFNQQYDATPGNGITVSHPGLVPVTEYSNTANGAEHGTTVSADWNVTTANTVTVSGIALNPAESAYIRFRVTIQ